MAKTTEQLLEELDSLDLEESEAFLRENPGLRQAAYVRDMERRKNLGSSGA